MISLYIPFVKSWNYWYQSFYKTMFFPRKSSFFFQEYSSTKASSILETSMKTNLDFDGGGCF